MHSQLLSLNSHLCLLLAQVPPMSAEQARACIEHELGVSDLAEVFEWIDLEEPLGSASISQVRHTVYAHQVGCTIVMRCI